MKALAALSQFVNKTFALWVLVFAAIAYAAPDPFKPLAGWISPLLGLVMFGMGLTLSVNDFKLVLSKPMDVLIGILAQFIIMPTLAYLLCIVLQLPAEIAVGVILVGCCPGGTSSNVMTFLARGDTALSVTITSCTTLLAPIVTPALIWLFAHQWIEIDPLGMFWSICQIVLIPIAIGVAIHTDLPDRFDSDRHRRGHSYDSRSGTRGRCRNLPAAHFRGVDCSDCDGRRCRQSAQYRQERSAGVCRGRSAQRSGLRSGLPRRQAL